MDRGYSRYELESLQCIPALSPLRPLVSPALVTVMEFGRPSSTVVRIVKDFRLPDLPRGCRLPETLVTKRSPVHLPSVSVGSPFRKNDLFPLIKLPARKTKHNFTKLWSSTCDLCKYSSAFIGRKLWSGRVKHTSIEWSVGKRQKWLLQSGGFLLNIRNWQAARHQPMRESSWHE
jgi:hypothetical protein